MWPIAINSSPPSLPLFCPVSLKFGWQSVILLGDSENKVSCSRTQHNDLARAIFVFSFRSKVTDRRPRILISYISFSHSNRRMDDDEKQKRLAAMMDNAKYVLFNPLFNSQK